MFLTFEAKSPLAWCKRAKMRHQPTWRLGVQIGQYRNRGLVYAVSGSADAVGKVGKRTTKY